MAIKQKRMYIDPPIVFTVGTAEEDDFTADQIEALVYKIAHWYDSEDSGRNYPDALKAARKHVHQCLIGQTNAGKTWQRAPKTLEDRIKIKCNFDLSSDTGIRVPQKGRPRVYPLPNEAEQARIQKTDEIAESSAPLAAFSDNRKYQDQMEKEILEVYPELDTPAHRPNVRRLAMLYAQQESVNLELSQAKGRQRKDLIDTLATIQTTVDRAMKSLEIHPDQLRKRIDSQKEGTIGDLVSKLASDKEFKKREKQWALTEALQLWWMSEHLNGQKNGPQLHPFEVWHLTRTRPIKYTCDCGREVTLVEGFEPQELRDYLVENGVLVEKPVNPHMTSEEDLEGLATFGKEDSTGESPDESEDVPDETE